MIATTDYGGHGPAVLLLHRTGGSARDWSGIAPLLTEHHHVLAVDLPGHGRSGQPVRGWSFGAVIDDLAELDLNNPALVGMSLGGMLALHWAHAHPACPAVVSLDGHRSSLTSPPHYLGLAPESIAAERKRLSSAFDGIAESSTHLEPRLLAEIFGSMQANDAVPLLATMPCPALVVVATRTQPGAEEFATLLNAHRRGLKRDLDAMAHVNPRLSINWVDASHDMAREIPDQLATVILDHLGKASRDRA